MLLEEALELIRAAPERTGIFTDFDGTLAEIVDVPHAAAATDGAPETLEMLAGRFAVVAVVSGRSLEDLRLRLDVQDVLLAGSYGRERIGPHLYTSLPYDPERDFSPIILLARLPLIMTVNASVPAKSVKDVVELAKAQPGQLAFASSGNGGAPHLAGELFKKVTGTSLLHVPYRGSGPAVVDLIAGRTAIMFDAAPSLLPFITAGKLRPLAAASAQRHQLLPEIPTFAELGHGGMDIALWYGIAAPAGTPQPVVRRLNGELAKILEMPGIRESFAKQGANPAGGSPEQFDAFIRKESARWREVVKQAGIKPD